MNYTDRSWTLTLPPGTELLSLNGSHGSWAAKAAVKADLRRTFGWLARAEHVPALQWAHILYYIQVPRRFDPGNWMPTAKCGVDGIVDARVLPDDSRKHVVGPDPRAGRVPGFSLEIRELSGPPD